MILGGAIRSSEEALVMSVERRDCIKQDERMTQLSQDRRKSSGQSKPFAISKWDVMTAFEKVKANQGGAGLMA